MLQKGNYFKEQVREDQVVLFIRRHWLSFLFWIIALAIMILTPIILRFSLNEIYVNLSQNTKAYFIVIISAYILITLAIFLTAWIGYYLNVVVITPEHLVDIRQSGLFNRRVSEQSLLRVQDVSAHMKGFLQTFFRYGTVLVETAGEAPNFEMPYISQPNRVANTILKLHEEMVKRAGFSKKDLAEGIGLEKRTLENAKSNEKYLMENEKLKKLNGTNSLDDFQISTVGSFQGNNEKNRKIESNNKLRDKFIKEIEESINQKKATQIKSVLEKKSDNAKLFVKEPSKSPIKKEIPQEENIIIKEETVRFEKIEGELKEGEIIKL